MIKNSTPKNYSERRARLSALDPEACFIFFGASEVVRNFDTHFPFTQDSTFHYLTEYDEPDAALVLVNGKSHLFVQDREESREIWDGERYGPDRARAAFQVDEAYSIKEVYSKLESLLADAKRVYYTLGKNPLRDQKVLNVVQATKRFQGQGSFGQLPMHDPLPHLTELRIIKDKLELDFIRTATSASARAHLHLLKTLKPGMNESEAMNEFQYQAIKLGCSAQGYVPIFASGFNATTLHYVKNNEVLKPNDLMLIDAAGEVNGYTADITQTFPISGTFSSNQKRVYEKVLEVNLEITKMTKPGVSYRSLHSKSVEMLTEALLSLSVLSGDVEANIKSMNYRKYYPHGLGHYLGLDVHDVGIYRDRAKDFELKAGMLMTNEPGLYFRDRADAFFGIGVRIEDDLLITETGAEVLTRELPRDVATIENLRTLANQ